MEPFLMGNGWQKIVSHYKSRLLFICTPCLYFVHNKQWEQCMLKEIYINHLEFLRWIIKFQAISKVIKRFCLIRLVKRMLNSFQEFVKREINSVSNLWSNAYFRQNFRRNVKKQWGPLFCCEPEMISKK